MEAMNMGIQHRAVVPDIQSHAQREEVDVMIPPSVSSVVKSSPLTAQQ